MSGLAENTELYLNWGANFAAVGATFAAVFLAALTHYEGLVWINQRLNRIRHAKRRAVLHAVLGLILLHIVEIWIFGLTAFVLSMFPDLGHIAGAESDLVFDYVYFSAVVFTTVGFGDLSPVGPIRFLAGTEALTGFVLIGWSVSFTYFEMTRLWQNRA